MTGFSRRNPGVVSRRCSTGDCDLPHYAKDLCRKHYSRVQYRYASNEDGCKKQPTTAPIHTVCPRCTTVITSGRSGPAVRGGGKAEYLSLLTGAERAAYTQGYLDARSSGLGRPEAGKN